MREAVTEYLANFGAQSPKEKALEQAEYVKAYNHEAMIVLQDQTTLRGRFEGTV